MAASEPDGPEEPAVNLDQLMARRAGEYLRLWQRAATKFSTSSYRSADLLDDWFSWYGMVVRDATAATALWWTASGQRQRRPSRDATADRPRDQ